LPAGHGGGRFAGPALRRPERPPRGPHFSRRRAPSPAARQGHGIRRHRACLTASALLLAGGDVDAFGRLLAASLRWWLAGLPAGIGFATLRAFLKSCVGFPPHRSGVHSAGNGPAMRSAIIDVVHGASAAHLAAFAQGGARPACPGYFVPGIPLRNLLFMAVVLAHGLRRLAPPY
jgi:hypothetical protein